jgi:hypothetical protein
MDFQPYTFSGLPVKGPAPSCGHWVWFEGSWIGKRTYDAIMKQRQREKEKKEKEKQVDEVQDEVPITNTSSQCHGRRGFFSFAQFREACKQFE